MISPVLTAPLPGEAAAPSAHDIIVRDLAADACVADLRTRALADARQLRALARSARSDGLPKADLRAANATAAARSVLRHARRLSAAAIRSIEITN